MSRDGSVSSVDFWFKIRLLIGSEVVPLASEVVVGSDAAQDGTSKGFLFRLDLGPDDPPVQINLGDLVSLIEEKLGAGTGALQGSNGADTLQQLFPAQVGGNTLNGGNQTLLLLRAFELNSVGSPKLFRIAADVGSTDPTVGILALPPAVASWLSIDNLAMSFAATSVPGPPAIVGGGDAAGSSNGTQPVPPGTTTETPSGTQVELTVGLNVLLGGIPVALAASIKDGVYTFGGSIQSATLPLAQFLSQLASQFGVDVQLPAELNLDVGIKYVAGQVVHTPKTADKPGATQVAASGAFDVTIAGTRYKIQSFAAADLGNGTTGTPFVVGAAIGTDLAFAQLPLVGQVPGLNELTLKQLGFSYSNAVAGAVPPPFQFPYVTGNPNPLYTRSDAAAPEAQVYTITSTPSPGGIQLSTGGFSVTAALVNSTTGATLDNFALPLSMPSLPPPADQRALPADQPAAVPFTGPSTTTSPPAGPIHWVSVNKTFGPVTLEQIGLNYSQGAASFGLSGGFALGGFTLALQGLSITFPLSSGCSEPVSFDLQGLAMGFTEGPLSINGAFLKTATPPVSYYGEVMVQAASFGLKAIGGYTPSARSFFLYAKLDAPLGGPPFLFVTGLAAGLGVNNSFVLPTLDTLDTCPLLHNAPQPQATPGQTVTSVISSLGDSFKPDPGEYWVAAGIQFTSFEMIAAFAVITVEFGVDLRIALLGTCAMSLPLSEPLAYVEIDMVASFTVSSGLFSIVGKLSPASYILGGFAKLTGGFAFNIWLSGASRGDFVVSLGGYSPSYSKPDHYPAVPRLGMSFGLGPFQASGQAYFALVPSMLMAGITISATWSSDGIDAWLDAGFDFMVGWAPLSYSGHAYVSVGCSIDLGLFTVKVQVGADMVVWGPSFGGRAEIDLDVASFSIGFGTANPPAVPPLGWAGFKTAVLPADTTSGRASERARTLRRRAALRSVALASAPVALQAAAPVTQTNVIAASVAAGGLGLDITAANGEFYDWVLSPDGFAVLTNSNVPANVAEWRLANGTATLPNSMSACDAKPVDTAHSPYLTWPAGRAGFSQTQIWNPDLSILPMGLTGVKSHHIITLKRHTASGGAGTESFTELVTGIAVQPQLMDVNAALYGANTGQPTGDEPAMVVDALTGFMLTPIPRARDSTSPVPLGDLLFAAGHDAAFGYGAAKVAQGWKVAASSSDSSASGQPTLAITLGGGHDATFTDVGMVLGTLNDPWVAAQRAAILDDLVADGFATFGSADIHLTAMATETALDNWPGVALLGAA